MNLELSDDEVRDMEVGLMRIDPNLRTPLAKLVRDRATLLARVKELEAALPKTADGVVILPGCFVWGLCDGSPRPFLIDNVLALRSDQPDFDDGSWGLSAVMDFTRAVYSTEAAAKDANTLPHCPRLYRSAQRGDAQLWNCGAPMKKMTKAELRVWVRNLARRPELEKGGE